MNSGELLDAWRVDVVDVAKPYLWSDDEGYRYMDAAYRQFVRLTGGIPDFTSDATQVPIVIGESVVDLHPSILRIMSAYKSNGTVLEIVNLTDAAYMQSSDYGVMRQLYLDGRSGPVRYMIIGAEKDKAKWVQVPTAADTVSLHIYRLPFVHIVDETHALADIDEQHHIYLLDWMKHLSYKKQDAETFDKTKSADAEVSFRKYCDQCKREWERYKHKTRVVQYGGV